MRKNYYTYAYLRTDRTPYYIGKGTGDRAWKPHSLPLPPRDRILILKENLTEDEAYRHEVYMISVFGRKDIGTGILRNRTDGGDSPPIFTGHTEETRQRISETMRGRFPVAAHSPEIYKQRSISYKARGVKPPGYFVTFRFISPEGVVYEGENINDFAILHNLNPSALYDMRRGKQKQHRGWKLCRHTQS